MKTPEPLRIQRRSLWTINPSVEDTPAALDELVMAWARDRTTGEPRYILELDAAHRGENCNCECVSCGLPLIAVNAARTKWKRRPHFRHPPGAEKRACEVLAARTAVLASLTGDEVLLLPRRQRSATAVGLSGTQYEAWVEFPAEQVRVKEYSFKDPASAILTLDNGLQLRVVLSGGVHSAAELDSDGLPIPEIRLEVDEPAVAGMSPEEIRRRLRLVWDGPECWLMHWRDDELARAAEDAAHQKAADLLDWLDDGDPYLTAELRRESLLHREVKTILERHRRIRLPACTTVVEMPLSDGRKRCKTSERPAASMRLTGVTLEKRLGRIIPDVLAIQDDGAGTPLLIEVTVTNTIGEERLDRIRTENLPALEIDLSAMGGKLTRAELEKVVLENEAGKRWLHHPWQTAEGARLTHELSQEIAHAEEREGLRKIQASVGMPELRDKDGKYYAYVADIMATPISILGQRYLDAVARYAKVAGCAAPTVEAAAMEVRRTSGALARHGYKSAQEHATYRSPEQIVLRLHTLRHSADAEGIPEAGWRLLTEIMAEQQPMLLRWHTLYLIALMTYRLPLDAAQLEQVTAWRAKVVGSVKAEEITYLRDTQFDSLLAVLFPEMAEGLTKTFGTRPVDPTLAWDASALMRCRDPDPWLRGNALEEWKMRNPESIGVIDDLRHIYGDPDKR